jgi:hypothetical protein
LSRRILIQYIVTHGTCSSNRKGFSNAAWEPAPSGYEHAASDDECIARIQAVLSASAGCAEYGMERDFIVLDSPDEGDYHGDEDISSGKRAWS